MACFSARYVGAKVGYEVPISDMPGTEVAMDEAIASLGRGDGADGELQDQHYKSVVGLRDAAEQSMADQPLTTLGIAVAIGFVLGAIWRL